MIVPKRTLRSNSDTGPRLGPETVLSLEVVCAVVVDDQETRLGRFASLFQFKRITCQNRGESRRVLPKSGERKLHGEHPRVELIESILYRHFLNDLDREPQS